MHTLSLHDALPICKKNYEPKIIAVSKTFSLESINPLIDYGHIHFGENKVQEATQKWLNLKSVNKSNINDLINAVLEDLEQTKFINDKFYSNSKAKSLIQRGSSINKIRNYLLSKGIKDKYISKTLDEIKENNEDQDFFSAIKICKKKRIGPSRDENNRPLFYKKDIGILARSGFDFDTSKRVMDLEKSEYLKIINLL